VQLYLAGNQGESLANESVDAVRNIVANSPPPPGLTAYVTGSAPLTADQQHAGDNSIRLITMVTIAVIFAMLLIVYRSIVTVLLVLVMVFIELAAARGIVAFLGYHDLDRTLHVRSQSADHTRHRRRNRLRDISRRPLPRGTSERRGSRNRLLHHVSRHAHVILGSGLTIAGATYCLHFTRLPYFHTLGVPLAIGMLVAVAAALTMAPAVIAAASRFGLLDPKRTMNTRGWRRVGTAVVRWPGPILAASLALALVGLLALPIV